MKQLPIDEWSGLIENLFKDKRKGVQNLAGRLEKKLVSWEREKERLREMQIWEMVLYKKGYNFIAGLDEAGRGPLAGPVVAACVILPLNYNLPGLNDSKKLSAEQRERLARLIKKAAVAYSVGVVNHYEIDCLNIRAATQKAMVKAVDSLSITPDYLLIDALEIKSSIPQESIIRGDQQCAAIAAASILAKTTRDALMDFLDSFYPQYGFKQNKGYGTTQHFSALREYGPSDVHRRSFLKRLAEIGNRDLSL